ncbi:MAG: RNA polymerase factor sigma-54 [Alphaproteobacteria bacterium]|nr:MAG: RNA polymerase factor sigma-54 [Alphaproteobacteria bacterium]
MAIEPRLELRQGASLVLTPQLQQAISLLQMSNVELSSWLQTEMAQNPFLETAAPDPDSLGDAGADEAPQAPALTVQARDRSNRQSSGSDGHSLLDQLPGRPENLREHLWAQIEVDIPAGPERLVALSLMENLDESGYLTADLPSLAQSLGCPIEKIEAVLERVQGFDPPGIFARSLKECLSLQLKDQGRFSLPMQKLLDHLDLLARREMDKLSRACGVDAAQISAMVAELRLLDPKPALVFNAPTADVIQPDVLMRPAPANEGRAWRVELNPETLPRVLVNEQYFATVRAQTRQGEARSYMTERFQAANWLVRALHQRATTLLNVASEIVRQQEAFFVHGVHCLRPMMLRDIAKVVEVHESTVSRVVANKFMSTPRGTFALKSFFSNALSASDGQADHSVTSVRHRIRELINTETTTHILSDEGLCLRLREEGVDIARRTVAKYRESMHIPPACQRRRDSRLHAS